MKAALGEVNLTIIAVVAIGLVAAVATPLIKNALDNIEKESKCSAIGRTYVPNRGCCDSKDNPQNCIDVPGNPEEQNNQ